MTPGDIGAQPAGRKQPSPRTLDAALRRLLVACSSAERRARESARAAAQPAVLMALARRRRADLELIEAETGARPVGTRSSWSALLRRALAGALRVVSTAGRDRARYAAQVRLADVAITACSELLAMRLGAELRRRVELVHGSLESDRRELLALARGT